MEKSSLNLVESSKILWKYDAFGVPKPQRCRNFQRIIFIFCVAFCLLTLMQVNFSFYFQEMPENNLFEDLEDQVPGWEKYRNMSIPNYISPDTNTTIIEPTTLCKEDDPLLLIVFVLSSPDSFENRHMIRQTWANSTAFNYPQFARLHGHLKYQYLPINHPELKKFVRKDNEHVIIETTEDHSHLNFHVRTVFLIGETEDEKVQNHLLAESQTHDDILQESFLDAYNNLTLKSAMMLKWINANCHGKLQFVMKCDEDTFVHVPNLIHFLLGGTIPFYNSTLNRHKEQNNENPMDTLDSKNRMSQQKDVLIGSKLCHMLPCTQLHDKWYTPRYMWDSDGPYPNFLAGGAGFVMTMDTAAKLYNASMAVPFLLFEDVYITGLCAKEADIKPTNYHLFNFGHYKDMCEFRGVITQHQIEPHNQKMVYDFIVNSDARCAGVDKNATIPLTDDFKESCSNKFTYGKPYGVCSNQFYNKWDKKSNQKAIKPMHSIRMVY